MDDRGSPNAMWVPLAEKFPATLAKDAAPDTLSDGQTPEAYGLGIDKPGYLYAEPSVSDGDTWTGRHTASKPTNSPWTGTGAENWTFFKNRLWSWRANSTLLRYGAYGYADDYILDGLGYVTCDNDDSVTITEITPFGDNVAVFTSDRLSIVKNADNPRSGFVAEYVQQSSGVTFGYGSIAIDNTVYWNNQYGVFGYDGQQVQELTSPIRNNLGAFESGSPKTTFRGEWQKKRLVGRLSSATRFIIDLGEQVGLYDYSTSGFRFATRTISGKVGEPLVIDKIAFMYQYDASKYAKVGFDVKINDDWKSEKEQKIYPAQQNGRIEIALNNVLACRRWALRLTSMSEGLYISRILVHVKQGGVLGYSAK